LLVQEKLDDHPAKVFRHPLEIPSGYMHKPASFIEAAFQHYGVPV
jgi:hypothetical protein